MPRLSPILLAGLLLLTAATCKAHNVDVCSDVPRGRTRRLCLRRSLAARLAVAAGPANCPRGCHVHGVCNEELGRCDCPRHFTGPACKDVALNFTDICKAYSLKPHGDCLKDPYCFNQCSHRGKCIAGMCHCEPGFWGMDCSISWGPDGKPQLLEGRYKPRKTGVKVYVYELPSNLTSWFGFSRMDRPLHLLFWQRLMSSGMRTLDGNEADYYYIPINARGSTANEHLEYVIPYIQRAWPWWSKDNGHRHLIIHTGDMGIVDYPLTLRRQMNSSLSNITWLTHWGLYDWHPPIKWEPAHRPGKDIVIPVMIMTQGFHESPMNPAVQAEAEARGQLIERKNTLFFAGRICGDRNPPDPKTGLCTSATHIDYSLGVRQQVYKQHRNTRGFKIVEWTKTYLEDISSHKFCLAPTGGGHGKRQILVTLMGCIPVLIGDKVLQPFEPEIDWSKVSVSVPEADIPDLPRILGAVPAANVAAKQKRLRCMAQHLYYSSSLGAILGEDGRYDAFETTMEILRVRKEHPDVPPEKYTKVDERFRKFVNCELGGPEPLQLCTQGKERQFADRGTCNECRLKDGNNARFFSSPGGLLCCGDADMTQCPRAWV